MHLDSGFDSFKPTAAIGIRLPVTGNHLDFVARSDHAAGHFVRAGAAGHIGRGEILVDVDDFH